jgi:hypothetical protein
LRDDQRGIVPALTLASALTVLAGVVVLQAFSVSDRTQKRHAKRNEFALPPQTAAQRATTWCQTP